MDHKSEFLNPRSRYYGSSEPKELLFNANLQEFSQRVNFLCALETSGKISSEDAYDQIQSLWKSLKKSKHSLDIA
ncbi:MAG: hypothetical protein WBA57_22360 [Elainellaceae cyanobacterium]